MDRPKNILLRVLGFAPGVAYLDCGPIMLDEADYLRIAIDLQDWNALANYLEGGYPLTDALRAYVVEVLRGKKRLRGRRVTLATLMKRHSKAEALAKLERAGMRREDRLELVSKVFEVEERSIERAVEDVKIHENPTEGTKAHPRR